jgi:GNAT superfamily N-acetyltransferase
MAGIRIEHLPPTDARRTSFHGLRERIVGTARPEPLPEGAACALASRDGAPVACCTLQMAEGLHDAPGRSGLIGHYDALDAEAGAALLVHARDSLAREGAARVLGPMNGSTWARYRLALPPQPDDPVPEVPPFLGEPTNPPDYPDHFTAAGFVVVARYESRIVRDLVTAVPAARDLEERVRSRGIAVRTLDPARFDEELPALFEVSLAAFSANPYYTTIDFAAFRAMYRELRTLLDPAFVLLAHDPAGRLLAFQLAYPDPLSREGERLTRVVVKSIATVPEARGLGLGNHLFDRIRERAHEQGFRAVIHALMHVTNFSMNMSERHRSAQFRRYALYQWIP